MSILITPYSDNARGELLSLWSASLPLDAITVDTLEARVLLEENFDPETFFIARSNGAAVGFVLGIHAMRMPLGDADPEGDRCWITALGVHPSADLNEVGSLLLKKLETKFRSLNKRECWIAGYPPG